MVNPIQELMDEHRIIEKVLTGIVVVSTRRVRVLRAGGRLHR